MAKTPSDKLYRLIRSLSPQEKRYFRLFVAQKAEVNGQYQYQQLFEAIADMAVFPWLRSWKNQGIDWNDYPHLKGWFDEIAARPAVQRGVEVLADRRKPLMDDKARQMLFGNEQYKSRG